MKKGISIRDCSHLFSPKKTFLVISFQQNNKLDFTSLQTSRLKNQSILLMSKQETISPAHELWVELETRIASQELHDRSGDEETAAKSIVSLFATTRELMRKNPDDVIFCDTAATMLNRAIRPCTARWHGWITNDLLRHAWTRRQFRNELRYLRRLLRIFARGLRYYSRENKLLPSFKRLLDQLGRPGITWRSMDKPLAGDILETVHINHPSSQSWQQIKELEHDEIASKRGDDSAELNDLFGVCLSGGGIRSATFSLGIIGELARRQIFHKVDYLSTVSGGGYLGTFLTSWLGKNPRVEENVSAPNPIDDLFDSCENGAESKPLRHLRNRSRYIAEGGAPNTLRIVGLLIAGLFTNLLILAPLVLIAALLSNCLSTKIWGESPADVSFLASPVGGLFISLIYATLGVWFSLAVFLRISHFTKPNSGLSKARFVGIWLNLTILALTLLSALVAAVPAMVGMIDAIISWKIPVIGNMVNENTIAIGAGAIPVIAGSAFIFLHKKGLLHKVSFLLLTVSGPLFYLLAYLLLCRVLVFQSQAPEDLATNLWLILFAILAWILLININTISPHRFYRNRLASCYLIEPAKQAIDSIKSFVQKIRRIDKEHSSIDCPGKTELSKINASYLAPYHLLNGSVNLPSSKHRDLRGRDADFFLFSKHICGSPLTGYSPTSEFENLDPHLDLGTAMAISGAAVGSNMGGLGYQRFRFALALLNFRLGYWIANPLKKPLFSRFVERCWKPKKSEDGKPKKQGFRTFLLRQLSIPGPQKLIQEMFGLLMDEKASHLNVSDGGHIENLGLYELLRRKCKYIISVDGACDPTMNFKEFRHVQRLARIDFGIEIEIDLSDLSQNQEGISASHSALGRIHYPDGGTGWIIFLKLAITGDEKDHVADYRARHSNFPHESTGDQIYSEEQFEAYRSLGQTAAQDLFPSHFDYKHEDHVQAWFHQLAEHLLPDNHDAFQPKKADD